VATRVKFADLSRNTVHWKGKCIAVDGYWQGLRFLVSKDVAMSSDPEAPIEQLGLYGREALLRAAPKHAQSYTAVGKIGDCKALWDAASMVLGYCHSYASGPFIALVEMRRR
jgi:hypothetical protein